jgi:outer membrane lipoprotein-sorting protein
MMRILLMLSFLTLESIADGQKLVLERMRAEQASLRAFKARIEQVKTYPQLGIEDPVERGFLYLQRGKMRLEILEPEVRILVVNEGRYVLYQPRIRQAISGRVDGQGTKGLFPGLLTGSPDSFHELEKSYETSDRGEETLGALEGQQAHHLSFRARPGTPVYCQEIELFIDSSLLLPVLQKCREANRSEIALTLSEFERNPSLDEGLFELRIPDGVERIERGRDE